MYLVFMYRSHTIMYFISYIFSSLLSNAHLCHYSSSRINLSILYRSSSSNSNQRSCMFYLSHLIFFLLQNDIINFMLDCSIVLLFSSNFLLSCRILHAVLSSPEFILHRTKVSQGHKFI